MHKPIVTNGAAVLVTGCSSGIGLATATKLARNGFTVFAGVRKEADAQRLRDLHDPNIIPVNPLDLTHLNEIPAAIAAISAELDRRGLPGLYALVNNAGGGGISPIELLDVAEFQRELQTRLVGPVALLQAALPLLRAGRGRIIWIVTPATLPTPYVTSIHACDFAVNCLARTLNLELREWKIPTIQVRCGAIKTPAVARTETDLAALLQRPKAGLYKTALRQWASSAQEFDRHRTDAGEVAGVVMRALQAKNPRRRYAIGYMSGLAGLLEALPQTWVDALLARRS
jgi:NAD(P)-dependent dehydrogenase (short-subunit alcohol dehydrogenase family)